METSGKVLKGGFSTAYTTGAGGGKEGSNLYCPTTNNCNGGNCVAGCGSQLPPNSGT